MKQIAPYLLDSETLGATGEGEMAFLADFLEGDVQGDVATTLEILEAVSVTRCGTDPEFSWSGNAYCLTVSNDVVVLENMLTGSVMKMTPEVFRQAMEVWLSAIRNLLRRDL